jgi:hypothetical protein
MLYSTASASCNHVISVIVIPGISILLAISGCSHPSAPHRMLQFSAWSCALSDVCWSMTVHFVVLHRVRCLRSSTGIPLKSVAAAERQKEAAIDRKTRRLVVRCQSTPSSSSSCYPLSHSINAIGPAPLRSGRKRVNRHVATPCASCSSADSRRDLQDFSSQA